ncbi:MAG: hypothetical protein M3Y04_10445, partial [Actinomycetota bacterium]|nr:hypothetical protein [Actinomycetota bacterium]
METIGRPLVFPSQPGLTGLQSCDLGGQCLRIEISSGRFRLPGGRLGRDCSRWPGSKSIQLADG